MLNPIKASVWIHRHIDTGQPFEVDLLSISGEQISVDFIRWFDAPKNNSYLLRVFAKLQPERCYSVLLAVSPYFDDGYHGDDYEIELLSWVENRADEDDDLLIPNTESDLLGWLQF